MKVRPLSAPMLQMYGLAMFFFTANAVLTVIFPIQAAAGGFKEGEIGVMMAMYMLVCMFLRPFAGQMVAKHSPFTIMKWLLFGHAVALLIYIVFGIDSLYIVRILQGIITAFFSMAMQLGIADVLREEDRGQGMSMYSLSTVMPSLYGPALALLLWSQFELVYLLAFIAFLAVVPLLCFIRSPLPKTKIIKERFSLRDILYVINGTKQHQGLMVAAIVMTIGSAVFGAISTFLPLYLLTEGAANPTLYLFIQAIVVVVSRFLLRQYIPSDGKWHPMFIALVLISSVLGTTLLALLPVLGSFVYISALFNGLASAMLYPTITTYMSFAVPKESRYVLLGLYLATYDLGFGIGSFLMGFVVQLTSYSLMFIACSIIAALALGIVFLERKSPITLDH
ncbi:MULTISPECIES: staphylopine family metallophore export MFS transporter CntE [unclassified Lysinibacillus]|uniref:staphylopine family metallophore export MFS transporter CntE n=1 Tax=unclassified Lysinibacillus TaxID=2636778 RepID=UPI00381DCF05